MIHIPLALAIQGVLYLAGINLYVGALTASLMFLMREITQAEYRWIEANGGLRAAMPWWKGMDVRLWNQHSIMDVVLPAFATFSFAYFL